MIHIHPPKLFSQKFSSALNAAQERSRHIVVFDPVGDHGPLLGDLPVNTRVIGSILEAYYEIFDQSSALWIIRLVDQDLETLRLLDMLAVMECQRYILRKAFAAPDEDIAFVQRPAAKEAHIFREFA